jgi:tetratricopeptide (TPR) repeat protein
MTYSTVLAEFPLLALALNGGQTKDVPELLRGAFNTLADASRFEDALVLHEGVLFSLPPSPASAEIRLWCLLGIGNSLVHLGRPDEALTNYQLMRDEARTLQDDFLVSVALARTAEVAHKQGRDDDAISLYEESTQQKLSCADYFGIIENLIFVCMLYQSKADISRAKSALDSVSATLQILSRSSIRRAVPKERLPEFLDTLQYWQTAYWFETASISRAENKISEAIRISQRALKAARKNKDYTAQAKLLQNLGKDMSLQGRLDKALAYYHESLEIANSHNLQPTADAVTLGIAIALFESRQFSDSANYYESARRAALRSGQQELWASVTADAAAAYFESGDLEQASRLFSEAFHFYRGTDDISWQIRIMSHLLLVDSRLANSEDFTSHLFEAVALLPQSAYGARGELYRTAGNLCLDNFADSERAAKYFRQSVEEAVASGDMQSAGQRAALAASSLSAEGAVNLAVSLFDRAAELFSLLENMPDLWRVRNDRGICLTRQIKYDEAIEEFTWCVEQARQLEDHALESQALLNLAETQRRVGDIKESIEAIERSLYLYRDMEDEHGELDALNTFGLCLLETVHHSGPDQIEAASTIFERALTLARVLNDRHQEAFALRGIGRVEERRGNTKLALTQLERAANIWEEEGDYAHCAEALAAMITLHVPAINAKQFTKTIGRLLTVAKKGHVVGTAARAFVSVAGVLVHAGILDVAAEFAFLALQLNAYQTSHARPTQDEETTAIEYQDDLYDIVLHIVDLMEMYMNDEQRVKFFNELTKAERFDNDADRQVLINNIGLVREDTIEQKRYSGGLA